MSATGAGGASSISVTVRVRPFTIREAAQLTRCDDSPLFLGDGSLAAVPTPKLAQKGIRSVIKVVDDKCLVFDPPEDSPVQKFSRSVLPQGKRVKDQTFGFDRVFDENTSQGDVYESTTRSLLDSVLDGYNATVFAYGATGCGKTHTITGTAQQPGIIFMTMQELFERIGETTGDKVTEVSLSYLEIYNETIRDLLVPGGTTGGSKSGLMLREDANQVVSVAGLSSHHPQNVEQVMEMIMRGNEYRTMSPTEANATSSRSHAVLQINMAQKDRNADVNEPHTMATLSIIDLAGSERASATKNRGERLIEGANINRSLLALGSCINALCDPRKRNHVPYRDSKLTRLLKFSLGGNCKTVMIVCVSPSSQHFDETQNTLRYANRAKNIQTKVTRNVYNVNRHVKDFLVKIDEQMAMINELKNQQKEHESLAFAKFKKQNEKKESIAKEGIARIRSAFDNSAPERQEKTNNMIKLRQIGRRISMLSSWLAAFDEICDSVESDEPMKNMQAMRKTAHGIMVELENSRHHCRQKSTKSSWERALNSALENGLRQLKEIETGDALDAATLSREVEMLKAAAERDALVAVAEHDKTGDTVTVQVLLRAHFETISCIEHLNRMSVDEAVEAATGILSKVLMACTRATSYVVKPDGSIAPVETFAPSKSGTPKRRKAAAILGVSPVKPMSHPAMAAAPAASAAPHLSSTPVKASPRRKGMMGSARKGVIITPRKRTSPIKKRKRGVRWRDDTEDGTLAEFEQTPQQLDSTPEADVSSTEICLPQMSSLTASIPNSSTEGGGDSSPIPEPPQVSVGSGLGEGIKTDRFKTGFLSKKSSTGSPLPSAMILSDTLATQQQQQQERRHLPSSDHPTIDHPPSPLRNIAPDQAQNHLSATPSAESAADVSGLGSDVENNYNQAQPPTNTTLSASKRMLASSSSSSSAPPPTKAEALKIRNAVKRASMAAVSFNAASSGGGNSASGGGGVGGGTGPSAVGYSTQSRAHNQRRRSPTARASSSASSSPPSAEKMFSAGHARRMVGGSGGGSIGRSSHNHHHHHHGGVGGLENEWRTTGVLSPRITGAVGKNTASLGLGRRMTTATGAGSAGSTSSAVGAHHHHPRLSSVNTATAPPPPPPPSAGSRGSLMVGGKGLWR